MSEFDREIESELSRVLGPVDRASIPAWRTPASGGVMKRLFGGAGVALGAKLLTGFAVAALAMTAAGVTTEVATTGSLNPMDWGQQVKEQVQDCKDTLRASGVRGIGECVSAFAKQHGKIVSGEHRNSDARTNHGNNGKNNDHSGTHGKPSGTPGRP
jgi:hypothetical protein